MREIFVPAAAALAWQKPVIERVFSQNSDLYAVYAGSGDSTRLTRDGRRKEFVAVAPGGSRVAFVVNARKEALGTLVVISAEGATVSETVFRPAPSPGAMRLIDEIAWLTPDRLVVSGSFSPLAAEYVIVDANTGAELRSYFVRGAEWSPDPGGAHVAYEYFERPRFCVDGECYPKGNRRLEFDWPPSWSGDGLQVAIQAKDNDARGGAKLVIVKRVSGSVDELASPLDVDENGALFWDGPALIVEAGRSRWKRSADGAGFVQVVK